MKKPDLKKLKEVNFKKAAKDFVYGKPHGERRLGDLYIPKTGLYKHREWRGIKDTQGNMEIQMDGSDISDSTPLVRQMS